MCGDLKHTFVLVGQTGAAAFGSPTFEANSDVSWPADPYQPGTPSITSVRPDRPRLIAPHYKWEALSKVVAGDPYLFGWNETIFGNATDYLNRPPVQYVMDGPSGILDNAREIKMRIKAFAYVYRVTGDSRWSTRAYEELQVRSALILPIL